ncbi:hypothetical protein VFPPC_17896 [Pochonia chlamydosporia 170]|uniref:Uncharacterized protein n=1 Tax=Pochonia chlamydosporia 170 TaxID=1380566 RepID=A0A219AQC1_METCM|nr:hypothetical protein VFPPC_17896 [Pochonia chlamydosporia 170]OWT42911.1 hypothetical protein VFPPC_17896 [Pochonia chlamydosporia 170]
MSTRFGPGNSSQNVWLSNIWRWGSNASLLVTSRIVDSQHWCSVAGHSSHRREICARETVLFQHSRMSEKRRRKIDYLMLDPVPACIRTDTEHNDLVSGPHPNYA